MTFPNLPRGRRAALLASCLICLAHLAQFLLAQPTLAAETDAKRDAATAPRPAAEILIATEPSEATRIVRAISEPALRAYLIEVLERNPELQALRAGADALSHRPDQVGALPDPMLQGSLFVQPPETRVGPQRLQVGVQQRLPSKARRRLQGTDAVLAADAATLQVRTTELHLVTEARQLWLELGFVDRLQQILREERNHLERHEEAARARYASGIGLALGPVKIQAELTRIDASILDTESRRHSLLARLDALRNRFDAPPNEPLELPPVNPALNLLAELDPQEAIRVLTARAMDRRPEVSAARTRRDRAALAEDLAATRTRPDFAVGLGWTLVEPREDDAGRANPPQDNGRDVLAITGGMSLPLWRRPRQAELAEALARSSAAGAETRAVASGIQRQITDLVYRLPLEVRQLTLIRDVLERQAAEAVSSVVTAYASGKSDALDLLDAEHRLFEVRQAIARAQADVAIALAQLEGAVGEPLAAIDLREVDLQEIDLQETQP